MRSKNIKIRKMTKSHFGALWSQFGPPCDVLGYIMHLDIWSPGSVLYKHEDGVHLLNCMCDLTQFIVSCILTDTYSEYLRNIFMEQVVLNF